MPVTKSGRQRVVDMPRNYSVSNGRSEGVADFSR